jgi:hypothetical protein
MGRGEYLKNRRIIQIEKSIHGRNKKKKRRRKKK